MWRMDNPFYSTWQTMGDLMGSVSQTSHSDEEPCCNVSACATTQGLGDAGVAISRRCLCSPNEDFGMSNMMFRACEFDRHL
jgi:hypothetical protein